MLPLFNSKIKKNVIKVKKHVISRDKMEIKMGWLATDFSVLVGSRNSCTLSVSHDWLVNNLSLHICLDFL